MENNKESSPKELSPKLKKEIEKIIKDLGLRVTLEQFPPDKHTYNWASISAYGRLSEEFIREFEDYILKGHLIKCQDLSEELLEYLLVKYDSFIDWDDVPYYQKMSERLIERFQSKMNWIYVSTYQKLSKEFILKHQNKICWGCVIENQNLPADFILEFAPKMGEKECNNKCESICLPYKTFNRIVELAKKSKKPKKNKR